MKRLLFSLALLLSLNISYGQNDFGVIVYYWNSVGVGSMSIGLAVNNLRVSTIGNKSIIVQKIFSEGELAITAEVTNIPGRRPGSLNSQIKNNDTLYIRIKQPRNSVLLELVEKSVFKEDILDKKFTTLNVQENINFPYNPIVAKKIFKGQERTGTGFLLSKDGYILTNYHVVEKANQINVKGVNGNKKSSFSASLILKDEVNDLAIIKLDDRLLLDEVPFSVKPAQSVIGEKIFVLGYPLTTTMGEDIKMTDGIISSKNGYEGNINSYQISAPVQPGNSGGPLFDELGNLVGIINAKHTLAENASYAIKSKYLVDLLDSMDKPIKLPEKNLLADKTFPDKVAALQNFVYIIEVK